MLYYNVNHIFNCLEKNRSKKFGLKLVIYIAYFDNGLIQTVLSNCFNKNMLYTTGKDNAKLNLIRKYILDKRKIRI